MHYVENMRRELRLNAHSCGAAESRRLSREMCHVVIGPGRSVPLSELYPAGGSS